MLIPNSQVYKNGVHTPLIHQISNQYTYKQKKTESIKKTVKNEVKNVIKKHTFL